MGWLSKGKEAEAAADDGGQFSSMGRSGTSSAYALSRASVNKGSSTLFRPKQFGVGECFHTGKLSLIDAQALVAPPDELVIADGRFLLMPRTGAHGRKQLLLFVSAASACKRVLIDRVNPEDDNSNLLVDGKECPFGGIGDLLMVSSSGA